MNLKIQKQIIIHILTILICLVYAISKWKVPTVLEDKSPMSYQDTVEDNLEVCEEIPQEEEDTTEVEITTEVESESQYPTFDYIVNWNETEVYELAKIAECEGGNQNIQTRILIIMVVLNRVQSDNFPDNIHDVIFEENNGTYQFSPLASSGNWWNTEPSEESYEAVTMCMEQINNGYDKSEGALYFEAFGTDEEVEKSWHSRNLQFLYKSQNTRFYK